MDDEKLVQAQGASGRRRSFQRNKARSTDAEPFTRLGVDNDALEEMDNLFKATERDNFKSLVAEDPQVKQPKRFSDDNVVEGHFKENQFARPHEPLKHAKKKKKSHASKDGDRRDAAEDGGDEELAEEDATPTVKEAEPAPGRVESSQDVPLVDKRSRVAEVEVDDDENRVMFSLGQGEEAEEDDDGQPGSGKGERRHRRHRDQVEDPAQRRVAGSELASGRPADAPADMNDVAESHRYEEPGPRRKVKKKEDRNISNVVHLGDVNTGQTMLLGNKTFDRTPHDMFVEMDELFATDKELEWQETARWIKYEEDVEQCGNRWGKPHLATLSFLSLMNLRRCLEKGVLLLDVEEHDSVAISHRIATALVNEDHIQQADFGAVMRTLLLRRQHVGDHAGRGLRKTLQSLADMRNASHRSLHEMEKKESQPSMSSAAEKGLHRQGSVGGDSAASTDELRRFIAHQTILRHIAPGTEVFSVNVGKVDFAKNPIAAFVRLAEGTFLPGITEMPLPVRFIFFLVGPSNSDEDYHETGRAFSTLMSSPSFHEAAYKAENRNDLMWAFKEFLDDTLVLPPIDWSANPDVLDVRELQLRSREIQERKREKQERAELVDSTAAAIDARKASVLPGDGGGDMGPPDDPLVRHGIPFSGFFRDIKRRYPWYLSDFKDGLNGAVFSASFFIFFAALAGAITFGGLMMDKTDLQIGISETLISTSMVGITFALFSCQPLIIVGTTGPVLLFDEALFQFANSNGLEFLPMRVWIGIWMLVISLVLVGLEGSVLVKKFTRFTTEIFSSLVSILFVFESLAKLATVFKTHPLMINYCAEPLFLQSLPLVYADEAKATGDNTTAFYLDVLFPLPAPENSTDNATMVAAPLPEPMSQPNTALLSALLMFGTYGIANCLRQFRNGKFLGRRVRRMLGDFGVPIAILLMVGVDQLIPQVFTQHLQVPEGLSPSDPELRGWFISPLGLHKPTTWLTIVGAIPAAGLIFIVIYMETMVCQLIMAKPERNLKKGTGFHFDIVLISLLNLVCTLIGAPWMCAATIRSVSHAAALTVMSTTYAPGEKPTVVGVYEQRLSALLVSILLGLSVALSDVLGMIPVSVVFGVFMYMGFSSMTGVQMLERCVLFLKPTKHHPKVAFVKKVRTWRMHLYTVIQVLCLGFLLGIKFTPAAIGFPFFLAMLIPLRLLLLPKLFSEQEIEALDGDGSQDCDDDDADFYEEAHTMPAQHTSTVNLFANSSLQLLRVHSALARNFT